MERLQDNTKKKNCELIIESDKLKTLQNNALKKIKQHTTKLKKKEDKIEMVKKIHKVEIDQTTVYMKKSFKSKKKD